MQWTKSNMYVSLPAWTAQLHIVSLPHYISGGLHYISAATAKRAHDLPHHLIIKSP